MELRQSFTRSRSDLLVQSLIGVRQWLKQEWDLRVASPALTVAIVDNYKSAEKVVALFSNQQPGEALPMPYAVMVPTQIAPRLEGFNQMAIRKLGLQTGFVNNGRNERREKLTPIDVGIGVQFTCNDMQEALMFAQLWVEHAPTTAFDVVQKSTGYRFIIVIAPDPNVDIPQDREENESLKCMTTLIVKTFTGTTEINKLITKIDFGVKNGENWNGEYGEDDNSLSFRRIVHDGYKLEYPAGILRKLEGRKQ